MAMWTEQRRAALVNYPGYGRLWLYNAYVEGDLVIGEVQNGGKTVKMNFPKAAIVRWSIDRGR